MTNIDIAVKGIVIHNDRILLVQRAATDETGASTWESVGGQISFGETPEQALQREFQEEIGLNIRVEQLLYCTSIMTSATRQVIILVYTCNSQDMSVTLSAEHSDYRWATLAEAGELLPEHIINDYEKHNVFKLFSKR